MKRSRKARKSIKAVRSKKDTIVSKSTPSDDQCFLLYFITGLYFGPDLKAQQSRKSVFQRQAENLQEYTYDQLTRSHLQMDEIERIYNCILRKADTSVKVKPSLLHQFLYGNLENDELSFFYPQFNQLFPPHLHPHSTNLIENVICINNPETSYLNPFDLERFKNLTCLEHLGLDVKDGESLYDVAVREAEQNGDLANQRVPPVVDAASAPVNFAGPLLVEVENDKFEPAMIYLPSRPSKEEWKNIVGATKSGYALTGSAATRKVGPVLGLVDIGECEDSYLFRVTLPGVRRDQRDFSCEVESDGKVSIKGVTSTGEKTVCRYSQMFEMQSQNLCPPGRFSISFKLPGPVDPQRFSGNFGTDGILEGIVMKERPKKITN
jgi:hypothetical protein